MILVFAFSLKIKRTIINSNISSKSSSIIIYKWLLAGWLCECCLLSHTSRIQRVFSPHVRLINDWVLGNLENSPTLVCGEINPWLNYNFKTDRAHLKKERLKNANWNGWKKRTITKTGLTIRPYVSVRIWKMGRNPIVTISNIGL